jgi:hypothetical protein
VRAYDVDVMTNQRVAALEPAAQPGGHARVTLANGAVLRARSVVLATGARWRHIGVPGEAEHRNQGVAYCPHCDGPLFKGKKVAVIGGGSKVDGLVYRDRASGAERRIALAGDFVARAVASTPRSGPIRGGGRLHCRGRSRAGAPACKNAPTTTAKGKVWQRRRQGSPSWPRRPTASGRPRSMQARRPPAASTRPGRRR